MKMYENLKRYDSCSSLDGSTTSEIIDEKMFDRKSGLLAVEQQTELMHKDGTIWTAVLNANMADVQYIVDANPRVVNTRGPVGECPIHMLFLYGTEAHLEIARYLITRFPPIVTQIYNKEPYSGENILHIAIIKQYISMIEWLLSEECIRSYREELLSATAHGEFFRIGRPSYYGETPLGFACCTNQWDIVEILLKYGADMNTVDHNGNTILHMLVIRDSPETYLKFQDRWKQENKVLEIKSTHDKEIARLQPWNRFNKQGFTPLTLAADLGHANMLLCLFTEREKVLWRYGNCSCVLHPLHQLDHGFEEDADGAVSVLDLIVEHENAELMLPMMISLIDKKWNQFAYRILIRRFITTFVYLLIFLGTTILEQVQPETTEGKNNKEIVADDEYPTGIHQISFAVGHLIVVMGALWKGFGELKEMSKMGIRNYFKTTGSVFLENCLACSFCICILIVEILRLLDMQVQVVVLAFAALLGWGYMLFFIMPFRFTGPFVIMIYKMLFNDVLRFCIIYVIFLAGFSQAFFILFNSNGFYGYISSVKQCFLGMLGDFDLDAYVETPYPFASVPLLIFYIVLITILLLNLLIASMGDTFANVKTLARGLWHLERARIVLSIESEMSTRERKLEKNKYWVDVGGKRYLQVEVGNNEFGWNKSEKKDDD